MTDEKSISLCPCPVSTEEQKKHGLSVDAQITALKDYCEQNDIEIYDIYNDAGKSAHASYLKRKELLRLISDAQQNKADIILFTRLDRWFRSLEDYYAVMSQIPENVPWKTIWEDYETVTSAGRFKVNIMLSIAQAEAERTAEKIKETFEYKRAKGDYVGSAPFGYKRQNNRLVKDPDAEKYVEIIFDTYLKKHSALQAMRAARSAGSTITRSGVFNMLKNETYTGNAKGTKCEPYISYEQFLKIQEIKDSNYRTPKYEERYYIFQRLCTCAECGQKLRGITRIDKQDNYKNYACGGYNLLKHKGFSISERKLEKYLLINLDEIIRNYNLEAEGITTYIDEEISELEQKRAKLQNQIERIGVRFELGDYTIEEYKQKRFELTKELENLPACIQQKESIELPNNWKDIYNSLDVEHKQQFWFDIIDKIEVNQNHEIKVYFN